MSTAVQPWPVILFVGEVDGIGKTRRTFLHHQIQRVARILPVLNNIPVALVGTCQDVLKAVRGESFPQSERTEWENNAFVLQIIIDEDWGRVPGEGDPTRMSATAIATARAVREIFASNPNHCPPIYVVGSNIQIDDNPNSPFTRNLDCLSDMYTL